MALESCLQHKISRGFPATMSPLRFQRRQAWIIQSPPSPHSDFILFMYRSGFLNLSKFDDFPVVKTTRSISNVFYNRNLIDNISQFCSPIPYWNISFVAMSERSVLLLSILLVWGVSWRNGLVCDSGGWRWCLKGLIWWLHKEMGIKVLICLWRLGYFVCVDTINLECIFDCIFIFEVVFSSYGRSIVH